MSSDKSVFLLHYNRIAPPLYGLAIKAAQCREKAGKIVQEVFIKLNDQGLLAADAAIPVGILMPLFYGCLSRETGDAVLAYPAQQIS